MENLGEAVLLRIFIGESDTYEGKPMYKHLLEYLRGEGVAGATVFRGMAGFGKTSVIHTTSILRLSTDLPIMIEVVDTREVIDRVKPKLCEFLDGGLITEEKVRVVYYDVD